MSDGETQIISLAPGPTPGVSYPFAVVYCGECSMPLEYCEFSGITEKCRKWAENNAPEVLGALTIEDDGQDEKSKHQKRGGKGVKPVKEKKVASGKITLQREPRGKKSVTVIRGLALNDIDLKVAAKFFAQKFACGSSVTGADEIVIQGDVKDDLFDLITAKWPQVSDDLIEDLGDKKR
ncbi:unnamed protein product [Auanema sp. JU1783]|nr:unnamed protein product [Auanema sp. JU1783]